MGRAGLNSGVKILAGSADESSWSGMIRLTRLNHAPVVLNSDLIEQIEETPDTIITLTTRQIVRVREPVPEVLRRIVEFRRSLLNGTAVILGCGVLEQKQIGAGDRKADVA